MWSDKIRFIMFTNSTLGTVNDFFPAKPIKGNIHFSDKLF